MCNSFLLLFYDVVVFCTSGGRPPEGVMAWWFMTWTLSVNGQSWLSLSSCRFHVMQWKCSIKEQLYFRTTLCVDEGETISCQSLLLLYTNTSQTAVKPADSEVGNSAPVQSLFYKAEQKNRFPGSLRGSQRCLLKLLPLCLSTVTARTVQRSGTHTNNDNPNLSEHFSEVITEYYRHKTQIFTKLAGTLKVRWGPKESRVVTYNWCQSLNNTTAFLYI